MVDAKSKIQELVRQAKKGDSVAFGKIYDLLLDRIYRFVFFRVGRREDAEDITEAVFLKAWQALGSYREVGPPFEAWLFRICRNLVIDHWRTRKQNISIEAVPDIVDNRSMLPDDEVDHKIQMEEVMGSLEKIKSSYKEIIIMKFVEEKSNEEISEILGKPKDHVRVLQSRAIKALKKVLEEDKRE